VRWLCEQLSAMLALMFPLFPHPCDWFCRSIQPQWLRLWSAPLSDINDSSLPELPRALRFVGCVLTGSIPGLLPVFSYCCCMLQAHVQCAAGASHRQRPTKEGAGQALRQEEVADSNSSLSQQHASLASTSDGSCSQ
jgi:hypothetical protein